jgi:hypothetical protein
MKVLILGGTVFLGRHLTEAAASRRKGSGTTTQSPSPCMTTATWVKTSGNGSASNANSTGGRAGSLPCRFLSGRRSFAAIGEAWPGTPSPALPMPAGIAHSDEAISHSRD